MADNQTSIHLTQLMPVHAARPRLKKVKKPTRENPLILSASELKTFLRCRTKWAWRYHLKIVPRAKPVALAFGGLIHEILEHWYRLPTKKRTIKGMRRVAKGILQSTTPDVLDLKDLELAKAMCIGYAEWAMERDSALKMRNLQPELWFDQPLTESGIIRVRGKIDLVFEQRSLKSTMGALEHKSKRSIDTSVVDLNQQVSVYLWAMRRMFPEKKRYVAHYNVLRKQMPGPRVRAALFARESVERMDEEIEQWAMDTELAALDMLDAAIYPNPTDQCSWDCDYQTPCMLRSRPTDLEAIFTNEFMNKDGSSIYDEEE